MTPPDLKQIRNDLRSVEDATRDYRNRLGPSAIARTEAQCVQDALNLISRARSRLNEAIGWSSEAIR